MPVVSGIMQGQTNGDYLVTSTYQVINDYADSAQVVLTPNTATGTIILSGNGSYDANFTFSGSIDAEEVTLSFEFYNNTSAEPLWVHEMSSGKATDTSAVPVSASISIPVIIADANSSISVRVKSSSDKTLTLNYTNFSVKSIRISSYQ